MRPHPDDLHPQLRDDCHRLGRAPSGQILLHRNARVPWLILVPTTDAPDLLLLPRPQREQVLDDCARLDRYLRRRWDLDKVNFAAIGNLVPQLHLHLVGRRRGDGCWPLPVWGHLQEVAAYPAAEVEAIARDVAALWA
ncbi:MAG: HIT domain-containing protein [Pseudomonadota bacterium]